MDSWHSEWVNEEDTSREVFTPYDSTPFNSTSFSLDYAPDSTNFSRDDSIESGGEEVVDKNDSNILKPTFKSVLQAKKRLQAYSAAKQLKRTGSKEEKTEDSDKNDKSSPKKSRKAVYPGDKAKAVIQEIEEIKKHEAKEARVEQQKQDAIIQTALRAMMRPRSRSLSPEREREKHFKRREIKRRNYRRSDSFNRKSPSPEDHGRRNDRSPPRKPVYPNNWVEYKQLSLTVVKDEELKLKIFPKQKNSQHELVSKLINFATPSPLLESFKYISLEEKHENVPTSFMRVTKTRPILTYNVNVKKIKESFITRNQLFQMISKDRRNAIENLINTHPRFQPNEKPLQCRQWYSKMWKKSSDAECKILENSVGLSFLQNYSDEEEEIESEEIVICSSTKEVEVEKITCPDIVISSSIKDNDVKQIDLPKETIPLKEIVKVRKPQTEKDISIQTNEILEQMLEQQVEQREKNENLRQEKSEEIKKYQQDELKQTRKAIRELEEELERRKAIKTEEEAKEKRKIKKKRRRKLKKQESCEDEKDKEETPKRKKKNDRAKKKKYIEEDSSTSEDEKRKKKKNKKTEKNKKSKSKRKKERSKKEETPVKEPKAKKRDEDSDDSNSKEETKRKKKKLNKDNSDHLDERNTLEEPKTKNKKSKKQSDADETESLEVARKEDKKINNQENEDYTEERSKNSGKKRRRKNRWEIEEPDIISSEQLHELEVSERGSSIKARVNEEINHESGPEQSTSKIDVKSRDTSREKSSKFEKESKRHNEGYASKSKDHGSISSERESRKAKDNPEKSHKLYESLRRKKESEEVKAKDVKSNERVDVFNKKYSERSLPKEYLESNRKYSERSQSKEDLEGNRRYSERSLPKEDLESNRKYRERSQPKEDLEIIRKYSERSQPKEDLESIRKYSERSQPKEDLESIRKYSERSQPIEDSESNRKYSERSQPKEDSESNRKYSERSEKRGTDGKSNRERKVSVEKNEHQTERSRSKERMRDKHQKDKTYKEDHPQASEKVIVKQEPDWENLRSKRKRHRNSDSKEPNKDLLENIELPDDLEAFPLEKEIFNSEEKDRNEIPSKKPRNDYKRKTDTPDTDEYRENWEKDIFPIWESEDEAPPKPREKLNNSWESDEEVFERGHGVVESSRPFNPTFDLEIPLNIKPFKRRELINPDIELKLLKRESQTLSEERRRLEIEKLRVKELELKVIREVENKAKEQYKSKVRDNEIRDNKVKEDYRPKVIKEAETKPKEDQHKAKVAKDVEVKAKEDQYKPKVIKEIESKVKEDRIKPTIKEVMSKPIQDKPNVIKVVEDQPNRIGNNKGEVVGKSIEPEKGETRKGRWDKKVAQPRMSTPKLDPIVVDKPKREIPDEDDSLTNVSSTTSLNNSSAVLENEYEEFMKAVSSSTARKKKKPSREKISSFESSSSSDSESSSSKNSQAKKHAGNEDKGRKNFNFKNIITNLDELNLPPLDSPLKQNSVMILPQDIPLIPMPLPQIEIKPVPVPSPTIDVNQIPKPLFNLGTITLDIAPKLIPSGVDSPSGKSLEFVNPTPAASSSILSPNVQKVEEIVSSKIPNCIEFASPLTDVSLDSVMFEDPPTEKDEKRLNDKPFVFTSMVLPSKRSLLNNSNLNFGDSEDEEANAAKSMKKLEEIIKENLTDIAKVTETNEKVEVPIEKAKEGDSSKEATIAPVIEKKEKRRSRSPASARNDSRRRSNERGRKDVSPRRTASGRREPSPRRRMGESSLKRRGSSPRRNTSPRKRASPRRRNSPVKRKYSPRRSISPRLRRRSSISPQRKLSPSRSVSKKMKSKSPEKSKSTLPPYKPIERIVTDSSKRKSPITITSPLEGLKRSVADSTISDDLLPQPSANLEEYTESPVSRFYDRTIKPADSPRRVPLDVRISQVLGLGKEEPKPISTTYSGYSYEQSRYHQQFSQPPEQKKSNVAPVQKVKVAMKQTKGSFVQIGNMVQIVPTEDIPIVEPSKIPIPPLPAAPPREKAVAAPKKEKKSQILQVGNMLQIVPADMLPEVPLPPEPKPPKPKLPELNIPEPEEEIIEPLPETSTVIQEKQSAETTMRIKVAERRAERDKRRQERERRRKEKEKRRKEKEKQKQIKLKQRTENMIKKALQLEVEGGEEEEETILNETPTQWPPLPIVVSSVTKEVGKSILIKGGQSKSNVSRSDKIKIVQFADGVKPGEGTSPSAGEELSSPPPASKKLPKEKRYKKTKLLKKNPKKKVKVKVIKKRPDTEESDEEDILPPPSPPPGSPPPHLFPPRIKTQTINNVHAYIPNVVPIQTGHNQQLYRPQLNIIMHPHHHGPPPPPHHHGPPAPHHGPPPPPHHGPPHHGPPPPPPPHHHHHGPPHFHHGPPGPTHHHGPPLPHGPPGHHHHGPPPPYH